MVYNDLGGNVENEYIFYFYWNLFQFNSSKNNTEKKLSQK